MLIGIAAFGFIVPILGAIAALEREDGGEPTLPYHRIVNAATGEPGLLPLTMSQ